MARARFPLTSEQMELLLAFVRTSGLAELAKAMAKDPSVVSRQLQRLAETAPVITKVDGRWQITPLGRDVNIRSAAFLDTLAQLGQPKADAGPRVLTRPVLVIVNAQVAFAPRPAKAAAPRSNADAEANIARVLARFRSAGRPVVHVRHVSDRAGSPFHPDAPESAFMAGFSPKPGETVVDKRKASAFTGTRLAEDLTGAQTIVVCGFTANECIDATARDGAALGFTTLVVGDGTASFEIAGPDGQLHTAERVHKLTLANLHAHFAEVIDSAALLAMALADE